MVTFVCPTFEIVPGFEVSVCECPKVLVRELRHVFPNQSFEGPGASSKAEAPGSEGSISDDAAGGSIATSSLPAAGGGGRGPVLAVATMQRADVELAAYADLVDNEKDRLLVSFMAFASDLSKRLLADGYWVDYIDPCSGLPMVEQSNNAYSEVDGMQTLLNYRVQNAGCCKIILHPKWGAAVYPATLFTTAPGGAVALALEDMRRAVDERERSKGSGSSGVSVVGGDMAGGRDGDVETAVAGH